MEKEVSSLGLDHNQLAVIQRWSAYIVEPVYSGHP